MLKRLVWTLAFGWLAAFPGIAKSAIENTLVADHLPISQELHRFMRFSGKKNFRITLDILKSQDLARLAHLKQYGTVEARFSEPPPKALLSEFQEFARAVPEAWFLFKTQPTVSEVQRILSAGFQKLYVSVQQYPLSSGDLPAYALLGQETWVVFNTGQYPKPEEQMVLLELPKNLAGLQFVVSSWPRYYVMDFLNRLAQPKRLNVQNIFPNESDLTYLKNIKQLVRLGLETDGDPASLTLWSWLSGLPFFWSRAEGLPSEKHLQALRDATFEKLIIRDGKSLSASERTRLEALPYPVEVRWDESWETR